MSVLVTGGCGFIGMNIVEELVDKGIDVVIYEKKPLKPDFLLALKNKKGKVDYVSGDILDQRQILEVMDQYSVNSIIHGAAITPDINKEVNESKNIMNINIVGTIEVLEAARKQKIDRFIYLSSGSVYGEASFEHDELTESKTHPSPNSLYSISKHAGEYIVLRYRNQFKMNIVAVRVGTAYGPWEHETGVRDTISVPYQVMKLAFKGEKALLPRDSYKDWLYSKDAARAITKILTQKELKYLIYNISNEESWSILQWCQELKKMMPDFEYEVVEESKSNVDFYGSYDRAPLSIERLKNDLNFKNEYNLEKSFTHYVDWLKQRKEWFE